MACPLVCLLGGPSTTKSSFGAICWLAAVTAAKAVVPAAHPATYDLRAAQDAHGSAVLGSRSVPASKAVASAAQAAVPAGHPGTLGLGYGRWSASQAGVPASMAAAEAAAPAAHPAIGDGQAAVAGRHVHFAPMSDALGGEAAVPAPKAQATAAKAAVPTTQADQPANPSPWSFWDNRWRDNRWWKSPDGRWTEWGSERAVSQQVCQHPRCGVKSGWHVRR